MADVALIDVDGTLVDSNFHHAVAWFRAFSRVGVVVPTWEIHRHLGMGGDKLVEAVAGRAVETNHGDDLREIWVEEFDSFLHEIQPLPGAVELLDTLNGRDVSVVLATSGKAKHIEYFLDVLEAYDRVDAWTTSDDVDATKPDPDLLSVALAKVGGGDAVSIGDSPWDCEAARRIGVDAVAVRTGGFSADELTTAGAMSVFDSPADLLTHLDQLGLR
jgi:HAD superfamily hydrolase (TIGR01549 family)